MTGDLHPHVRIVETDHIATRLYVVELHDDTEWLRGSVALPIEAARRSAQWFSDVLRYAERRGHEQNVSEARAENRRMHNLISSLVAARTSGRLRRDPAVWDSDAATQLRRGAQAVFDILSESMEQGGYSASHIVERLREVGIPVTISCLHGHGLAFVANAITDYAEREFLPKDGESV